MPVVAVAIPLVQLTDNRKKRGQGEGFPNIRQTLCSKRLADKLATINNKRDTKRNWPATNAAGLRRSILAVDGDAIKLHTMIDQTIAKAFSDDFL